jgi:hypothetical protein
MKSKQNTPPNQERDDLDKILERLEKEVLKELESIPDTEGETNES